MTLEPGETMTQTVELLRDPTRGTLRYQLINAGTFEITAVHEALRGVPETRLNTIVITLNPGGSASGLVTNATDAASLAGATIEVLQDGNVLVSTTTDEAGNYTVPELPAGTFTFAARAPGFLRSTRESVVSTAGEQTVVNFNLSPLLTAGELRLVLTWDESPSDLDSHLWLPVDRPFHIFFSSRCGELDDCPFANLDVDDTRRPLNRRPSPLANVFREPTRMRCTTSAAARISAPRGPQVQMFDTSGLVATFDVLVDAAGLWWHVLDIDGETGNLIEVNTVGDDPAPYQDSDMGCSAESQ